MSTALLVALVGGIIYVLFYRMPTGEGAERQRLLTNFAVLGKFAFLAGLLAYLFSR